MQLFDNVLWGHADGTYKEFRAGLDDDVDEIVEFTFCVIVAGRVSRRIRTGSEGGDSSTLSCELPLQLEAAGDQRQREQTCPAGSS